MDNQLPASGIELFAGPLEIDEAELSSAAEERGTAVDLSEDLRLLARKNYLRLLKTDARREKSGGVWRTHTGLRLASTPDPACRFVWVSLTIRLDLTPHALVTEIKPTKGGKQEVKFTRKISPALEAQVPGVSVKATLGAEKGVESTIEYPLLVGSNYEDWANWTFRAPTEEHELALDHPLSMVTEFPMNTPGGLRASIDLSARIAFRDWRRIVPLMGRRDAKEQGAIIYLDQ